MKLVLKGHITPGDKRDSDYAYIPFELPRAARRLHVSYSYSAPISSDRHEGGNVIDIGLFDPRGADFPGGAGFRGWSGSARSHFAVTPTAATPGYLPDPLPAGRYQIVLGLYRIWEHGADYEIEIEAHLGAPEPSSPVPEPELPSGLSEVFMQRRAVWLRGDLQSHTEHSDAKGNLSQLTAKARALGLDFLAVTDHNTVSHHAFLSELGDRDPSARLVRERSVERSGQRPSAGSGQRLLLIPGQESTSYYGHMNIWGTSRWCDFRCRSDAEMRAVIDLAHAGGGLCSMNHPKQGGPAWEYDVNLPVDAMEVWQGPWPWRNEESLALWEGTLVAGRRLTAVGGSDYHCPAGEESGYLRLGQPTTWVKATERTVPAILDGIRAGRVSISAAPDGPRLDLCAVANGVKAGMGEVLTLAPGAATAVEVQVDRGDGWTLRLIADGVTAYEGLITTDPTGVRVQVEAEVYVRAELVGDAPRRLLPDDIPPDINLHSWRWALSNPVYIKQAQRGAGV